MNVVFLVISALAVALSVPTDDLQFSPSGVDVVRDSSGFVQGLVKFTSTTGDSVRITSITGSCRCAMGTIQRPMAYDTLSGAFYFGINARHFTDSLNYVDYTIEHTGPSSPSHYRVVVRITH
jgi:hypothetical protein